ncbi:MAG: bifunctional salicylyl-CoA 5-hydroxylase/oxidoreductase [Amylibacter sp.]|nr:bifunctional salicylyl-CoA 5-hydroxylase/oxidoreductase [Amylibacter sp.]MDG1236126.1 bifunctional salicylyl-CoA 5-hydroxylase/oxidoreductase [Amylibacter sp.]MDG1998310.1 bifunctional salicylyl-CoA 5-hydroxylase/oxidoreductase [Amylibacter sp.]
MRIACLGGGPSGLYFAISMKLRSPSAEVVVIERNKSNDTFGWGVVLSDETLSNLAQNDPISAKAIGENFAYWDDIALHYRGETHVSSGHGFCGIGRKKLLVLLQDRARELGVEMRFETEVGSAEDYRREFDVVVASDGLNSKTRAQYAKTFQPETDQRLCQFVWLGTRQKFSDAFTFIFEETEHGWVWAHAYQFDDDTATFIIECSQDTFDKFGFGEMSQQDSIKICEDIFKNHLQGHSLMTNATHIRGSAWLRFPRVLCKKWYHENIVLLGDASATAHFSIGSGTKLALESAVALAEHIHSEDNLQNAFERYQEDRLLEVLRLQSAARNSLEWFEQVERYLALDPVQLNYSMLTRSQRISHENLRERDPEWLQSAERWFMNKAGMPKDIPVRRPMFAPFKLRDMELKNRIVVSPMAQYMAQDGIPNDWHLSHYGERAKGGAALVYTEMTCVSAVGRITPGCPGLYSPKHEKGWKKLTNFVHDFTEAKICCQIGHSGRKGSTNIGWEGMDKPLASGNWDVVSASAIPWSQDNATPREITKAEMDEVRDQFVASAQMADRAGFDMIELHAAHGYLISSFISPVSNTRRDAYGGSLEKRMSYPLEVFSAMRAAWPKAKPMSVRISANDWVGDAGVTPQEAVDIARLFADAGADLIDVSAGQTTTDANPVYGRMFQTPFSDRIRNDAGLKTMAVGNIYEADHANSILMAGRADLIAVGRPHLNDPYWTLHEGTKVGDRQAVWPRPYEAGRDQAWRLADREAEMVRP